MNKYISSALVLVISAIFFAACTTQKSQTEQSQQTQESAGVTTGQTADDALSEWQEFAGAVSAGESVHCEMINTETQEVGDYYMKSGKMRYNLTNPADASKNAAVISDGEYTYSWSEERKEGLKFKFSQPEAEQPEAMPEQQQAPDFTQQEAWDTYQDLGYTVDCSVESVSDDMFTPPADVTFTDLSEFYEAMGS